MFSLHKNQENTEQKRWHQSFILLLLLGLVAAASLLIQTQINRAKLHPAVFGITYSTKYAYELGLDTHKAYIATLDDLQVKHVRLPIYWSDVEKEPNKYDWSEVRWLAEEAAKRNVKVTFAIGMRTPRYPECHFPEWAKTLSRESIQDSLLLYVKTGIKELDGLPAVVAWQLENEPFFAYFGQCPPPDDAMYAQEVSVARSVTKKPIITTASGEFGSWLQEGKLTDRVGISLYRGAYLDKIGYFAYPIPFWYYAVRHAISKPFIKDVFISELQVEPWFIKPIGEIPVDEQTKLMPVSEIRENIEFARTTGMDEIWLWGVEWWYFLKEKQGIVEYWDFGKSFFR